MAAIIKGSTEVAASGLLRQSFSELFEKKAGASTTLLRHELQPTKDPLDDLLEPATTTTPPGTVAPEDNHTAATAKHGNSTSNHTNSSSNHTNSSSVATVLTIDDHTKVGLMLALHIIIPLIFIHLCIQATGRKGRKHSLRQSAFGGDITADVDGVIPDVDAEGDASAVEGQEVPAGEAGGLTAEGQEARAEDDAKSLKIKKSSESSVAFAFWDVPEDSRKVTFFEILHKEKGSAAVSDICEEPGIYTIMWASRKLTWDQAVIFILAVALQIFLPLFLFSLQGFEHKLVNMPPETSMWASIVWPLILVYTLSTIKGTVGRMSGMLLLRKAVPGWGSILIVGATVLSFCALLTLIATRALLYDNPTVKDMLLNACAVNFIPNMDKDLLTLLGMANHQGDKDYQLARKRLQAVADAWSGSEEQENFHEWFDLPMGEQFKQRPFIFLVAFADVLITFLSLGAVALTIGFAMFQIDDYFGKQLGRDM